jgi:hypothetical protein
MLRPAASQNLNFRRAFPVSHSRMSLAATVFWRPLFGRLCTTLCEVQLRLSGSLRNFTKRSCFGAKLYIVPPTEFRAALLTTWCIIDFVFYIHYSPSHHQTSKLLASTPNNSQGEARFTLYRNIICTNHPSKALVPTLVHLETLYFKPNLPNLKKLNSSKSTKIITFACFSQQNLTRFSTKTVTFLNTRAQRFT